MSQITINLPDKLILKLQQYEDIEQIIIQTLENYIETKTPSILKTKTWELCGSLEVTNPNSEYIKTTNTTLNKLIAELGDECQNVISLVNQFQLSDLTPNQQAKILSELLFASIHLHSHCDSEFQEFIADEIETLPDV